MISKVFMKSMSKIIWKAILKDYKLQNQDQSTLFK